MAKELRVMRVVAKDHLTGCRDDLQAQTAVGLGAIPE
jgi:hypothetical protein